MAKTRVEESGSKVQDERIAAQIHPQAESIGPECLLKKPTVLGMLDNINDSTVWRWEQAGRFPKRIRLSARLTVWRRSEILAWLEKQK